MGLAKKTNSDSENQQEEEDDVLTIQEEVKTKRDRMKERRRQRSKYSRVKQKFAQLIEMDPDCVNMLEIPKFISDKPKLETQLKRQLARYAATVKQLQGSDKGKTDDAQLHNAQLHKLGTCKPCVFLPTRTGCANGTSCQYCHICKPNIKSLSTAYPPGKLAL